jgi:hypothetical protein
MKKHVVAALALCGALLGSGHARADSVYPAAYRGSLSRYMVTVRDNCTGSVINGSMSVVTSAHCVVVDGKLVSNLKVWIGGTTYWPQHVSVDLDWKSKGVGEDVAILWFKDKLPVPSLSLATGFATGSYTALGNQMMGANNVLQRRLGGPLGWSPLIGAQADPEYPRASKPISFRLSACTLPARSLQIFADGRYGYPCGMIMGASGGALVARTSNGYALHGVIQAVYDRDMRNIAIPASTVREYLYSRKGSIHTPQLPKPSENVR